MKFTKTEYKIYYIDYWNNFLTVKSFADHYGFKMNIATEIIIKGRELCS